MALIIRRKPYAKVVPYVAPPMVERIYTGDLFDVLPTLAPNLLDACVTDPPYGLEFMGKEWDDLSHLDVRQPGDATFHKSGVGPFDRATVRHSSLSSYGGSAATSMQRWHELWAEEVWRVLKPGAYLVAFGGTRTFHRLTCAIEDAGFEIRDCLMWLYGTGFPKSLNISKAIDESAGAERAVIERRADGPSSWMLPQKIEHRAHGGTGMGYADGSGKEYDVTASATEAAQQWEGWGTALKPGWEPIILARKPLRGTVAENVLKFGTGAINIDDSRIAYQSRRDQALAKPQGQPTSKVDGLGVQLEPDEEAARVDFEFEQSNKGRWPANLLLDAEAALQLDAQTGTLSTGMAHGEFASAGTIYGNGKGLISQEKGTKIVGYGDTGGASRFFYCTKPSRAERDLGCDDLPDASGGEATDREDGTDGLNSPRAGAGRTGGSKNIHPTVKPLAVMRWLVKLVTPPGGIVLDPFLGSGTTAMACVQEGVGYIGVEREPAYVAIAERRVDAVRIKE